MHIGNAKELRHMMDTHDPVMLLLQNKKTGQKVVAGVKDDLAFELTLDDLHKVLQNMMELIIASKGKSSKGIGSLLIVYDNKAYPEHDRDSMNIMLGGGFCQDCLEVVLTEIMFKEELVGSIMEQAVNNATLLRVEKNAKE